MTRNEAVNIFSAYKSYEAGSQVLSGLSMHVEKGIIYGLLGASGCGKTTLLKCILGLTRLDSGHISVMGRNPTHKTKFANIGHMAQEVALYPLKIREIFQYFGKLLGLTDLEISTRSKELKITLGFNDLNQCVSFLSGGQRRRVSLAVALINYPKLLILDEPTAGIDPLLRESIWDHLCSLKVTLGTTIIVTTHHTEEAGRFDKIGIMRKGRLIGEDSPNNLIDTYEGNCLSHVLLTLCKIDDESILQNVDTSESIGSKNLEDKVKTDSMKANKSNSRKKSKYFPDEKGDFTLGEDNVTECLLRKPSQFAGSPTKIVTLTKRNFLINFRMPAYISLTLLLPLLQSIIGFYTLGRDPVGQILAVSNKEGVCHNGVELSTRERFDHRWVCGFLEEISKDTEQTIILKDYESKESARHSVEAGDTIGFMHFPQNFSQHNLNRWTFPRNTSSADIVGGTVQISLDMTSKIKTSFVQETLRAKYFTFMEKTVSRNNSAMDPRQVRTPLRFNQVTSSGYQFGWKDFLLPANIPLVVFTLSMICALSLSKDKEDGTLQRSQACGVELWHVYISYYLSESITVLGQTGIFFMSRFLLGGYTNKGSFTLSFLNVFLSGWVGIAFGLLLATVLSRSMEVVMFLLLVVLGTFYSCGFTWPLDSVSKPYRWICMYLNPVSLPIMAIRRIWNSAWGFEHPLVLGAFLGSIVWIIVLTTVGLIVEKRQRNQAVKCRWRKPAEFKTVV